jgi:hypothetical protein
MDLGASWVGRRATAADVTTATVTTTTVTTTTVTTATVTTATVTTATVTTTTTTVTDHEPRTATARPRPSPTTNRDLDDSETSARAGGDQAGAIRAKTSVKRNRASMIWTMRSASAAIRSTSMPACESKRPRDGEE